MQSRDGRFVENHSLPPAVTSRKGVIREVSCADTMSNNSSSSSSLQISSVARKMGRLQEECRVRLGHEQEDIDDFLVLLVVMYRRWSFPQVCSY